MEKQQVYHLEPETGLMNDPNGLVYYNGAYHVFFQWNRFDKDHSYKEWGHFTSEDLVKWIFQGSALVPDQPYDKNGVYSGSACVNGNQLFLFYTGNHKTDGKRKSSQCLAVTEDGKTFMKKGIILSTPSEFTEHFRDPKVWHTKSGFYMVLGAQRKNGKGAIALCMSEDGENWSFSRTIAMSDEYEMIECPDIFQMDGQYILTYCPQHRNNESDTSISSFAAYKVILFQNEEGELIDSNLDFGCRRFDYGFDFYAPQTFTSPDGRQILFAWMSRMDEKEESVFGQNETNIHCMTMPRELSLKNDELCQMPVKELNSCLKELQNIHTNKQNFEIDMADREYCVKFSGLEDEEKFTVEFQNREVFISYDKSKSIFCVKRKNWASGSLEEKICTIEKLERFEVWSDISSIEIFVNDGTRVFSLRVFPETLQGKMEVDGITGDVLVQVYQIMIEKGGLQ